jgi:hypothetical protein
LLGKIYMKPSSFGYQFLRTLNAERRTLFSYQQLQEVPQEPPPKFNAEDTEKPDLPLELMKSTVTSLACSDNALSIR